MSDPTDSGSPWSATPQPQPPGGWQGGPPSGPSGPRASFGLRFVAWLVDFIILFVVGLIIQAILGQNFGGLVSLIINFPHFGYFEGGPAGQTIGKRAIGIRVIRYQDGGPLGWGTALLRN